MEKFILKISRYQDIKISMKIFKVKYPSILQFYIIPLYGEIITFILKIVNTFVLVTLYHPLMLILNVKLPCHFSRTSLIGSISLMIMSLIFQKISQRLIQVPQKLKTYVLLFKMERYETLLWLQQNHEQKSFNVVFAKGMLKISWNLPIIRFSSKLE